MECINWRQPDIQTAFPIRRTVRNQRLSTSVAPRSVTSAARVRLASYSPSLLHLRLVSPTTAPSSAFFLRARDLQTLPWLALTHLQNPNPSFSGDQKVPMAIHFLLFLLFSTLPTGKSDLASDRAALLAFRSAVGRDLRWSASQSPCVWPGIQCSGNRVINVRLPGVGLMGSIPPSTVGNLTQLRTLSMRFNALSGQLPADFSSLVELRNLYLQGNRFSGEIPPSLFSLKNLVHLNLADNNFTGSISPSFNNLTRLRTLYLEGNGLDGGIPDLNLTDLQQFNVSRNRLSGPVPSWLRTRSADAFAGNSLCGRPLPACPGAAVPAVSPAMVLVPKEGKKKKLSGGAIAGIVIGSVLVFLLVVVILCVFCRKKNTQKTRALDIAAAKPPPLAELEIPTEKTAGREGDGVGYAAGARREGKRRGYARQWLQKAGIFRKCGRAGDFGTAYKAVLEIGTVVAVKRLRDVTVTEKEFREKMEAVGSMEHQNLVPLKAYYYSKDEKLLVYDYMPMGSLSALLHGPGWETRDCREVIGGFNLEKMGNMVQSVRQVDE
ncbi:hypothetical protein ACLOJK_007114 [Asimina triloba]